MSKGVGIGLTGFWRGTGMASNTPPTNWPNWHNQPAGLVKPPTIGSIGPTGPKVGRVDANTGRVWQLGSRDARRAWLIQLTADTRRGTNYPRYLLVWWHRGTALQYV